MAIEIRELTIKVNIGDTGAGKRDKSVQKLPEVHKDKLKEMLEESAEEIMNVIEKKSER